MDTYIILAGGFWNLSKKQDLCGWQVDSNDRAGKCASDYVIKVNGLPDKYFKPTNVEKKYRYYCHTCERFVTETELKERRGCMIEKDHELEQLCREVKIYESGVFDKYSIAKYKWLDPCYRIYLSNVKGLNKWRDIWRYINAVYPPTKRLIPDKAPRAVGNRLQWEVMEDDVPVINLELKPEIDETESEWKPVNIINKKEKSTKNKKSTVPKETVECSICGKQVEKKSAGLHKYRCEKKNKKE